MTAEKNQLKIDLALEKSENIRLKNDMDVKGQQIERLMDRLEEARAAAVQWVTCDGTSKTRPEDNSQILFKKLKFPVLAGLYHYSNRSDNAQTNVVFTQRFSALYLGYGDRWAYLPEPPVVKR